MASVASPTSPSAVVGGSGLLALKVALEKINNELKSNYRRSADAKDLAESCVKAAKEIEDTDAGVSGGGKPVNAVQADTDALLSEMEAAIAVASRRASDSSSSSATPAAEASTDAPVDAPSPFAAGAADTYWPVLKRALQPKSPAKVREIALDALQKLIAHYQFRCMTPLQGTDEASPPYPPNPLLIDEVIHHVCSTSASYADYASTEEPVLIQVIKVLLTVVTSPACEVHDVTLLKALQTSFNIYLYSRNKNITNTAKAALLQIVNLVAVRLERFGSILEQRADSTEDAIPLPMVETDPAPDISTLATIPSPVESAPESRESGSAEELADDTSAAVVHPTPLEALDAPVPSSPFQTEEARHENSGTAATTAVAASMSRTSKFPVPTQEYIKARVHVPNEPIVACYYDILRRDLFLCLRALCRLSTKTFDEREPMTQLQDEQSYTTRCRVLSLELIVSALNQSGVVFSSHPMFADLMRSELCNSLSRNGVSPNATIFQLALSIFSFLFRKWRNHLKLELEVMFNEIYLPILGMENASTVQKSLVMQTVQTALADPQVLIELYANYDCDLSMASLFERLVSTTTKTAISAPPDPVPTTGAFGGFLSSWMSSSSSESTDLKDTLERKLRLQALCTLRSISLSMLASVASAVPEGNNSSNVPSLMRKRTTRINVAGPAQPHEASDNTTSLVKSNTLELPALSHSPATTTASATAADDLRSPGDEQTETARRNAAQSPTGQEIEESVVKKAMLKTGVELFNERPSKGVQFLIDNKLVDNHPESIAIFLHNTPSLNKKCIGEYLGEGDPFNISVMHAFIDQMDFVNLKLVSALRQFLQAFRLPGEAQKIDRFMEKFSDRYCDNNPDIFANADTAYVLSVSIIMLNTDLHSKQVKHKMDKAAFLRNNRGINGNADLPDEYLGAIYDEVQQSEIVMDEDPLKQLNPTSAKKSGEMDDEERLEMYKKESLSMQKRSQARIKEARQKASPWLSTALPEYVRPMFSVAWPSLLQAFSQAFEEAPDLPSSEVTCDSLPERGASVEDVGLSALLALQGISACVQIACKFDLPTERDAFVSCLAALTKLASPPSSDSKQEVSSPIKPSVFHGVRYKNLVAVKALINLALDRGDALDSSWVHVLRLVSQIELFVGGLGSGSAPQSAVAALSASTGSGGSAVSSPSTGTADLLSPNIRAIAGDEGGRNRLLQRPGSGMFGQRSASGVATGLSSDVLSSELRAQSLAISIDRLYTTSPKLPGQAVICFFSALCHISIEEIECGVARSYSLEKIVEMCHYNMQRIRYVWSRIWRLLQQHFNIVGSLPDPRIASFAVDSLRQLCMKFLEKDELSHFSTQTEFLRPFEHIVRNNKSDVIRELVLQSVQQMIQARAHNIRSGWKSIFVVLSRVTTSSGNGAARSLILSAFNTLQTIYEQFMGQLGHSFAEFSSCLVDFALLDVHNVNEKALKLLRGCFKLLATDTLGAVTPATLAATFDSPSQSFVSGVDFHGGDDAQNHATQDEKFFSRWLPILGGFSKVVIDSPSEVIRSKALDYLYECLRSAGTSFDTRHWSAIIKGIIVPIFQDSVTDTPKPDSCNVTGGTHFTIWIQNMRSMVDLYSHHFSSLVGEQAYIDSIAKVVVSFVGCKHENLAQCAIICWHQVSSLLITKSLEQALPVTTLASWVACTDAVFAATLPSDLTRLADVHAANRTDMTRDELLKTVDFASVTVKCAVHLAVVQSVKDSLDALDKVPTSVLQRHLPVVMLRTWLRNIRASHQFAARFNLNEDLRNWIWQVGFTGQAPNLMKQETVALSTLFSLLFTLYTVVGDAGTTGSDTDASVVKELVESTTGFLRDYLSAIRDLPPAGSTNSNNKDPPTATSPSLALVIGNQRLLSSWCSIVIAVYTRLTDTLWPDRSSKPNPADDSHSEKRAAIQAILDYRTAAATARPFTRQYAGLAAHLQDFYTIGLALMVTEFADVRLCVLDFLQVLSANEILPAWHRVFDSKQRESTRPPAAFAPS
ncbi:guanine nucleotide exchange protein for ADP-robosylation factor [Sorochytrium milnesiophthora]